MLSHPITCPNIRFLTRPIFTFQFPQMSRVGVSQAAAWRPVRRMAAEARHVATVGAGGRGWWRTCIHSCVFHKQTHYFPLLYFFFLFLLATGIRPQAGLTAACAASHSRGVKRKRL